MMKAKAEAEAKEMQAKGLKRGEDFVDCESIFYLMSCPRACLCLARTRPRYHGEVHTVSALACIPRLPAPPRPCTVFPPSLV
jgi:hypothetical protein